MDGMNLYWGCAHTQFHTARHEQFSAGFPGGGKWEDFIERSLRYALGHLDFYPLIYYPASAYRMKSGLYNESVGMQDGFREEWEIIQQLTAKHYQPGTLVTFPGYEWSGHRTRWGDHNVVYFEEGAPLDLSMHIDDLFANLRKCKAIAIPHHSGYAVGQRGKDWAHHDPQLSPIAEIFSVHGSSEGLGTPLDLRPNSNMGPRVSGGTIQDGLGRGCKFGIIASGDNAGGFPGKWGIGLAAVWAEEMTREGIWRAFLQRRTYAVTGDRIKLRFYANDHFMGSEFSTKGKIEFTGSVEASDAVDRIELIRNGEVLDTYCHNGKWRLPEDESMRLKLRLEFGWGPAASHGLKTGDRTWKGSLSVNGGRILGVEKCFTRGPQEVSVNEGQCSWCLTTSQRSGPAVGPSQQALVLTLQGAADSTVSLNNGEVNYEATFARLLKEATVLPDIETSKRLTREQFGVEDFDNSDCIYYLNAYKILLHRAVPESGYSLSFAFAEAPPRGENYYYVRISQNNGQMAWSSPIWVAGLP